MTSKRCGFAIAGLSMALGLVAACSGGSDGMMQSGQGRVQFVMSASSPSPATGLSSSTTDNGLKSAKITFASILARTMDGELIDVTIDLPVTVDLIGLVSDGSFTLPAGFLPPGTYDQLVIVMTKAELTLSNDTVVTIDPPGGGWTAVIRVRVPFTVVEGLTTEVRIKFNPDRMFSWLEDRWEFHPEFECDGGEDDR